MKPQLNGSSDATISSIIERYKNHPSIIKIKDNVKTNTKFYFNGITAYMLGMDILKLDTRKASACDDIPSKILVQTSDIVSPYLARYYNKAKTDNCFPPQLKDADILPIHKKDEKTLAQNYRPVSLLPVISKVFERNMYEEIFEFVEKHLSPYLFGFRKGHSTEQCLIVMIERWRKILDEKGYAGALLTDLSNAFDCLNHDLLISKLDAYGFSENALTYIYSYLTNRRQRTKVGSVFSQWSQVKFGVPQGSILGPLLFTVFMNDMFYFVTDVRIASYADDTTLYHTDKNLTELLKQLEKETNVLLDWFRLNEMKLNEGKCHLMISRPVYSSIKVGDVEIHSEPIVNLLGISIDDSLKFTEHVRKMYKKGTQKLHALARISKYMDQEKLRILMKAFINSQFNYGQLIWLFHNRTLNNKINKLHERTLRIVYKDENLTFKQLLDLDGSVTIHQRNIQKLAIEMYKVKNGLSPVPVVDIFKETTIKYDLRNKRCWEIPRTHTMLYGTETIRYRGIKTWDMVPDDLKKSKSLQIFKSRIKMWIPSGCNCRLCQIFVPELGFLDMKN